MGISAFVLRQVQHVLFWSNDPVAYAVVGAVADAIQPKM